MQSNNGQPRGVLNIKAGEKKFQLSRYSPTQDLSFFVERYWIVRWDLRGQEPYVQETLPYPCVNLVFEKEQTRVFGVGTGKFSRLLENTGRVFGVKFKPGGFYPFVKAPVSRFTDSSISFRDAFGSPKWVIQRYRLHEVAERLADGEVVDGTRMALDLGYFDQAHFIKDFKAIVGKTPAEYARIVVGVSEVDGT